MILTKEVEIKPVGKMIQYYRDKGYDVKWRKPLLVKVEDLPLGSSVSVEVECDICKVHKIISFYDYNKSIEKYGFYTCNKCATIKIQNTCEQLYGAKHYSQTKECKDKIVKTCNERYGCDYTTQVPEIKEKMKNSILLHYGVDNIMKCADGKALYMATLNERYGVNSAMQLDSVKERMRSTMIKKYGVKNAMHSDVLNNKRIQSLFDHYGVTNPSQNAEIRANTVNTLLEKYGVENVSQIPDVQEKKRWTFHKNGTTPTSRQQLYIFQLYDKHFHSVLNFPIKYYSADICFPKENLIVEYDGGFHNGNVITGKLTQDEFNQKELIRNDIIKREGYKQIRIISSTDKLPSDEILLQILDISKKYFSDFPEHSWITFDIDASIVRNAEQKDGVFFDYGDLRRIA